MADSIDAVWALLQKHQQEVFHTAKGLPFTSYLYPVLLTLGVIAAPASGEAEQLHL